MKLKEIMAYGLVAMICAVPLALAVVPATQAVKDDEIKKLVKQLGNDEFQVREDAVNKLVKMGQDAVGPLNEAARSDDPEVKARAETALRRIETGDKPESQPKQIPEQPQGLLQQLGLQGLGGGHTTITMINGVKTISTKEGEKSIRITEGPDGINLTITENKDGKNVVDEYKAKNAEELKKDHPEAFAIYQRHSGGIANILGGNGNVIQLHVVGGAGLGNAGLDANDPIIKARIEGALKQLPGMLQGQLQGGQDAQPDMPQGTQEQLQQMLQQQLQLKLQNLQIQGQNGNVQPDEILKKVLEQLQQLGGDADDQKQDDKQK